jgi:hypothetical protein
MSDDAKFRQLQINFKKSFEPVYFIHANYII